MPIADTRTGAEGVETTRGEQRTRSNVRASLKHLLVEVKAGIYVAKLCLCGALAACGLALALQSSVVLTIAGVLILGCMFAHAAELQHEALHNLGFRSRRANTVAGIILGIPMLVSFTAFRAEHLRHHRYLGTPLNREFFDYGDQYGTANDRSKLARATSWFLRFSMLQHYKIVAVNMVKSFVDRPFADESDVTSRRIRRDYLIIGGVLVIVGAVSVVTGTAVILWAWLLPLVLVAAPVHALIELPEHFRCETSTEDPFGNTRTIRSNRLMMWFTNGNNYHVEHHLMPNMPIERLPDVHEKIRPELRYYHPTYVSYFRSLIRNEL